MIPANVLARRPLIGMIAGLLLVSACGSTSASTSSDAPVTSTAPATVDQPTTTPSPAPPASATTLPPATSPPATDPPTTSPLISDPPITDPAITDPPNTDPPTTAPPANPVPVDAVDVAGRTVFGVSLYEQLDVDAVIGDVSARLGSPTTDNGWQSTVGESCAGSTGFRVVWWGDFRMTFERYDGDGNVQAELSAWTVGDPTVSGLAPIGDIPAPAPSDIVTLEGIGLGSTIADVEAVWANVHNGGENRRVVIDRGGSLTIGLDDAGQIIGFGDGPFDCPVDEIR